MQWRTTFVSPTAETRPSPAPAFTTWTTTHHAVPNSIPKKTNNLFFCALHICTCHVLATRTVQLHGGCPFPCRASQKKSTETFFHEVGRTGACTRVLASTECYITAGLTDLDEAIEKTSAFGLRTQRAMSQLLRCFVRSTAKRPFLQRNERTVWHIVFVTLLHVYLIMSLFQLCVASLFVSLPLSWTKWGSCPCFPLCWLVSNHHYFGRVKKNYQDWPWKWRWDSSSFGMEFLLSCNEKVSRINLPARLSLNTCKSDRQRRQEKTNLAKKKQREIHYLLTISMRNNG